MDQSTIWDAAYDMYQTHLNKYNLARETARAILPVGSYTECYWKANLKNFLHMIRLRADSHAQWEIQEYAKAMYSLAKPRFPIAIESFEDYQMNGVKFSRMELRMLQDYIKSEVGFEAWVAGLGGDKALAKHYDLSQRELKEFMSKLNDHR
jgi:thymidylate synthase (FAD)